MAAGALKTSPWRLKPDRGSVYNAYWTVQKRGVPLAQRLSSTDAKGSCVYFDESIKTQESDGGVFGEAPRAWAAVRVIQGRAEWRPDSEKEHGKEPGSGKGSWLTCGDQYTPIVIEVARKKYFAALAAFRQSILPGKLTRTGNLVEYQSAHHKTRLSMHTDYSQPPRIDGNAVNYEYPKTYDSPFLQSEFNSGVITLKCGKEEIVLDFNKP